MKKTKIILVVVLVVAILSLGLFTIYFFTPKTVKRCGSALPITCQVCVCKRGIPSSPYIGTSKVDCLFGEAPSCYFEDMIDRSNNAQQECKDAKRIEFQEPINEITSAKIGSLGGTLQKKYDGDRWIIVKIPAGAVKNETNFSLIFKESNYIIRSGEKSPLTFEISPDISFDLPVEIIVQYGKTYGCNIVPVPYLVDENNELQPAQATGLYSEQRIFTMDTFHGGSYSWIYATE